MKASGNLALDDIQITYGKLDTVFVHKDLSVSAAQFPITGLSPETIYSYRVRAQLANSKSVYSETKNAITLTYTNLDLAENTNLKINLKGDQLHILGLQGNETVRIYNIQGICLKQMKASDTLLDVEINQKGIYIIQIQNDKYRHTKKIMK